MSINIVLVIYEVGGVYIQAITNSKLEQSN